VASDDVWAVGVDGQESGLLGGRPVVMHWDGRAWKRAAIPRVQGVAFLSGIAAMSSSDVWAVGWDENGALVMHWNGRAWSLVGLRGLVGSDTWLWAVDGASSHAVWAVGGVGEVPAPLSLHWDGRSWKQVPAVSDACVECGDSSVFSAVDVRATSQVWTLAASYLRMMSHPDVEPVLRWDGRRQRIVYDYRGGGDLRDLAAVSATDVWFVGGTTSGPGLPLIRHWNGRSWRIQRTPFDGLRGTTLEDVAALSATEIWAAGKHLIARFSC
jgi:hypothetical protein